MELNQIRYFLALAESLSFTDAARESGISQPSLTRAIQRLEDELEGLLLYRDGKDTRLTALGRDIQIEFMRILDSIDKIHGLAENSVVKGQRLTIGVSPTVTPTASASFWTHVMRQLPTMELVFVPMQPNESEAEILSGRYNLCLLPETPKRNVKLNIQPIYKEHLQVAMAGDHPLASSQQITPEQLASQPYLDRLHCEFRTALIKHFMDRNIVMRPRVMSDREDWVQQLVAKGLGICSLPHRSAIIDGITLRPVTGLDIHRQVFLVGVSGSGGPREVQHIIKMARTFDWGE